MPQIEEFIQSAVGDLGVSQDAARTGVGGVLQSLQQGAEPGDFQQLLSSMPGAAALLSKAKGVAAGAAEPGGGVWAERSVRSARCSEAEEDRPWGC